MQKPSGIGGQAVMEGIMMRHKNEYAIAVRKPDGEIEVKKEPYRSVLPIRGVEKIPIIRGVGAFIDSLVIGTRCILYSASFFEDDEEDAAVKDEKQKEREDKWFQITAILLAVLLTVGLFILLPYGLSAIIRRLGAPELVVSVCEALLRVAIFIAYMLLISRMKDIQRTFMYHGAEHKCINCVENGLPLTVENVMKSSRLHRRCGTSFLFLVMIVSIFLHFIFVLVPSYWLRLSGRLLMVPVVAGVSFEIIQWAGRSNSKAACFFSRPGLAMQRFTTKEPTPDMAEVAIKAVEAVFDWKGYLKEEFGQDFPEEETAPKKAEN